MQLAGTIYLLTTLLACQHTLASELQKRSLCTNFTRTIYRYEIDNTSLPVLNGLPGPQSYRISKGINCADKSKPCPVVAEGYIAAHPTLNISTDSADAVFALIGGVESYKGDEVYHGNFTSLVTSVVTRPHNLPGLTGWLTYRPRRSCITGTLSDCEGDIPEGTVVLACTPFLDQDGLIAGKFDFAYANQTLSEYELECNPAMTPAAKRGENPTDCASDPEIGSAKSGAASARIIGVFLAAALFGLAILGL